MAKAGGNDAILLQSASNWEIKGTAFTTCGHGGVDIDAGGGSIAEDNYIHDCRFSGGGDYDRAFLINSNGDFGAEGARNNRFIRNYVYGMKTSSAVRAASPHRGRVLLALRIGLRRGWTRRTHRLARRRATLGL